MVENNNLINNLNIEIYADGANIDSIIKLNKLNFIKGFTTNPSLMKKAGIKNYESFAKEVVNLIPDKPISFEVFADDLDEMEYQARQISSWGSNINVKIPITNTKGEFTNEIIGRLSNDEIKLNITAIFTYEQALKIKDYINENVFTIISVFAGRIADTGTNPEYVISKIMGLFENKKMSKILWASPREIYNIFQANNIGCHIITVADDILNKIESVGKDHNEFSLDTVKMFYKDATSAGFKI